MADHSTLAPRFSMETAQPAVAAFFLGIAALIMTLFGFTWLGWGFSAVESFTVAQWIIFYLAALALIAASIRALRRGRAQMKAHSVQRDDFWATSRKHFRLVTMFEGIACGLVVFLTVAFHRLDLLALGISLVVGVHFIPLAILFRFPAYYATGIAIVLADLVSRALFGSGALLLSVGVATGIILWLTAIYALIRSRQFFRIAPRINKNSSPSLPRVKVPRPASQRRWCTRACIPDTLRRGLYERSHQTDHRRDSRTRQRGHRAR